LITNKWLKAKVKDTKLKKDHKRKKLTHSAKNNGSNYEHPHPSKPTPSATPAPTEPKAKVQPSLSLEKV
jgi:replication initiation and membrane attachment protein DnaB